MGRLSAKFQKIYEDHRRKVAAVEAETAALVAALIAELESGRTAAEPEAKVPDPAPTPATAQAIVPLMVIEAGAGGNLELLQGDLAKLPVDAIVSPASSTLQGGSGLEGLIFAAAGPGLVAECHTLGGIERGKAKITKGYKLFARHVIHTAGPIWKGGDAGEPETLAACYRNSLQLALDKGLKTIAFPAISTGNFGYPLDQAARVGVREAARFVSAHEGLEKVYFVGFKDDAVEAFRQAMLELSAG